VTCEALTGLDFTYFPLAPRPGELVTFSALTASGAHPDFTWDFGDGSALQTGAVAVHAYAFEQGASVFPVRLSAENLCSAAGPVEKEIVLELLRIYLPWVGRMD
jgi:hypothetical protein